MFKKIIMFAVLCSLAYFCSVIYRIYNDLEKMTKPKEIPAVPVKPEPEPPKPYFLPKPVTERQTTSENKP